MSRPRLHPVNDGNTSRLVIELSPEEERLLKFNTKSKDKGKTKYNSAEYRQALRCLKQKLDIRAKLEAAKELIRDFQNQNIEGYTQKEYKDAQKTIKQLSVKDCKVNKEGKYLCYLRDHRSNYKAELENKYVKRPAEAARQMIVIDEILGLPVSEKRKERSHYEQEPRKPKRGKRYLREKGSERKKHKNRF